MHKETIHFKYYNPAIYHALTVIGSAVFFICVYCFLNYFAFPIALGMIFMTFVIFIFTLYIVQKTVQDLNGAFKLDEHGFEISMLFKKEFIGYSEITFIKKEYYSQHVDLIVANATQSNPGSYSIGLLDESSFRLKIARSEQREYEKSIRKLARKIYKTNRLGVHFTSSFNKNEKTDRQKEAQFVKEKPVPNYSLEKAIKELLLKSQLELTDLTV